MAGRAMTPAEFARVLQEVEQHLPAARKEALLKVAEYVRDEAKALIGQERPEWPPLAESTVEEKQRLGFTGKVSGTDPLLRTGEYRASIQVRESTPERSVTATDDPIAADQEFGTSRIPPRPVIGTAVFQGHKRIPAIIGEVMTAALRGSLKNG